MIDRDKDLKSDKEYIFKLLDEKQCSIGHLIDEELFFFDLDDWALSELWRRAEEAIAKVADYIELDRYQENKENKGDTT